MDTLTHALSGMLLARATADKQPVAGSSALSLRARLWAGFFAAAFPDSDVIASFFGPLNYLEMHRGITHSILMLPLWAMLLAVSFSLISKKKYHWKAFYFISLSGIAIHIAGDVITSYGTMIFAPLNTARLSWPTTFIIDFYFSGIIIVSILLFSLYKKKAKKIAIAGLVTLFCYVGFQAILHMKAEGVAETYVAQNNISDYNISVMPQPFSPFHWKIVIKTGEKYLISYINLVGSKVISAGNEAGFFTRINALYKPLHKNNWRVIDQFGEVDPELAKQAWMLDIMKPIRRFMLYPTVTSTAEDTGKDCIWFKDHRFVLDGIRNSPFVFGACKGKKAIWNLYRLDDGKRVLLSIALNRLIKQGK